MKTILTACAAMALLLGPTTFASAQSYGYGYRYHVHRHRHVAADGRCGGISYGTGARSCGTATGGPVGGLSSRN